MSFKDQVRNFMLIHTDHDDGYWWIASNSLHLIWRTGNFGVIALDSIGSHAGICGSMGHKTATCYDMDELIAVLAEWDFPIVHTMVLNRARQLRQV